MRTLLAPQAPEYRFAGRVPALETMHPGIRDMRNSWTEAHRVHYWQICVPRELLQVLRVLSVTLQKLFHDLLEPAVRHGVPRLGVPPFSELPVRRFRAHSLVKRH